MWDPHSYISQAVGLKNVGGSSVTLPSFYEFTTRPLLLKGASEQLQCTMELERLDWKSMCISFCGSEYAACYSIFEDAEEFINNVRCTVKSIEDDVIGEENVYSDFVEQVDRILEVHRADAADIMWENEVSANTMYTREAFLCYELRRRLCVPECVSTLLLERKSFHVLMKGEFCTVPLTAMIDSEGVPVLHEGIALDPHTVCCSNGICRGCRNVKDCCFVTVVSANEMGCAAGLRAAETVTRDEDVETVLRMLVDGGVLSCFSTVYSDGSVCQYEQNPDSNDSAAELSAEADFVVAHRTRVVRCSGNADAMHLLNEGVNKSMPRDVTALSLALKAPTLVATMKSVSDASYFEVVQHIAPVDISSGLLLFSVTHDSPLHNNVLKRGDTVIFVQFSDCDVWKKGPPRQWLLHAKCDVLNIKEGCFAVPRGSQVATALVFVTERSFCVGDSALIIGTFREADWVEKPLSAVSVSCTNLFQYTPFVSKFLHRQHGPIGIVGFAFSFCSGKPLLAALLLSVYVTDFIRSETDVDPTITLFFFRPEYAGFSVRTFPYFTEGLPCPLHHLTEEETCFVAGRVTCRLLQMELVDAGVSALLTVCVSEVAFVGCELLQFPESEGLPVMT
ncbi:hypothetical protein, conserved [Leishmania tarentolae]|uniref:Uncharacterized protein n=1 Tax=Leishmania tarentolae TaxID=5689 RepID=A0A640KHG8_LEITA|nr:hypothetical protein, conserved [Leishmania tarentolae]